MKLIAMVAAASFMLGSVATAQTWQDHYRAYDQAMAEGDAATAEAQAREAWIITRQTMEDSETRALLAQNYAELVVASDPEGAQEVLLDAIQLSQRGFGNDNLAGLTLQFMLAEAKSAASPRDRELVRLAVQEARQIPLGQELIGVVITQRTRLSLTLKELRMFLEMGEVGGDLSDDLSEVSGVPIELAFQAETLRAVALLSNTPSSPGFRQYRAVVNLRRSRFAAHGDRLARSAVRFNEILTMIGVPNTIDDYDPMFAAGYLWRNLMHTARSNLDLEPSTTGSETRWVRAVQQDLACGGNFSWKSRPMYFPRSGEGYIGVALIGYHFTPEGEVEGVRLLGEIPDAVFGEAAVRSFRRWKADVSNADPSCFRHRTMVVRFG